MCRIFIYFLETLGAVFKIVLQINVNKLKNLLTFTLYCFILRDIKMEIYACFGFTRPIIETESVCFLVEFALICCFTINNDWSDSNGKCERYSFGYHHTKELCKNQRSYANA